MKRITALLIAVVLLVSTAAVSVSAASSNLLYHDAAVEDLYYDYQYIADQVETVIMQNQGIAYWRYATEQRDKDFSNKLIDWCSGVMGEKPDKKYYTEILVNMITLMEYDLSQQVENQTQFDDIKNLEEYALDVGSLAANFIGISGASAAIKKGVELASEGIELSLNTIDELKYYETILRDYATADVFLEAIAANTQNQDMKAAASDLRNSVQKLFVQRIRTMATHSGNAVSFTAKSFFTDFGFAILKNSNDYASDPSVKELVDFGETAVADLAGYLSGGKLLFELGMLFGDSVFGTTNTFRRHNEIMALGDIADAVTKTCRSVEVSLNDPVDTIQSSINLKCRYYNILLTVHMRGEYLMYSLNQNDAGILSAVASLMDCFREEGESVTAWYKAQNERFESNHALVNTVLESLYQQEKVVHKGFTLYDGFIVPVQKIGEVPAGYIGIYSYEDFARIAESCPSDTTITTIKDIRTELTTANYILMNDITFPAEYDTAAVFCGILNGNGYTMKNISRPIFCYVGGATIQNLGMEVNCNTDLEDEYGAFGAIAKGTQSLYNDGGTVIENCYVTGSVSMSCRSGSFGGLIGAGAEISNCYNMADMDIKTRQGGTLGGISGGNSVVYNCYNEGALSMRATCENTFDVDTMQLGIGGIVGAISSEEVQNCYNTGTVKGETEKLCQMSVGGIAGSARYNSVIENSYNIGQVINSCIEEYDPDDETFGNALQPRHTVGGIAAVIAEGTQILKCFNNGRVTGEHYAGGIVGISYSGTCDTENCYNTGSVSAVQFAGGIVGKSYKETILCCFNTGTVSGSKCGAITSAINDGTENLIHCYYLQNGLSATDAGVPYDSVKALTEEEFGKMETFAEFDFLNVWRLHTGDTMPTLKYRTVKEQD